MIEMKVEDQRWKIEDRLLNPHSSLHPRSSPRTRIIGVEPEAVDDACRSLKAGRILPATETPTVADGLRTSLGQRTFEVIRRSVDEIVTVSEAEIVQALQFVWDRMKIVIEPSGAVAVAPLLDGRLMVNSLRVGVILSGGNVDFAAQMQSFAANKNGQERSLSRLSSHLEHASRSSQESDR